MNIGILGAGSLGTIMGAIVSQNGGSCVLIDANQEHVDALNTNGATITGLLDLNAPVRAITPDQMSKPFDIVIVLLKQTANKAALTKMLPFLKADSIVCCLQNGVPEEAVAEIIGMERTLGGSVSWGGAWISPGVAQLTSEPSHMRIEIGSPDGGKEEQLAKVAAFLKLAGEVEINPNLMGVKWAKLLNNCALSGMSAALGVTFGEIIDDDKGAACAVHIANELLLIAAAKGIRLEVIVPGFDYYDFGFSDQAGRDRAIAILRRLYEPHRAQTASMMNDMKRGIPCEIDFINGIVCDNGKKIGINTPFNQQVVDIVKRFEAKEIPFPTMANLELFTVPEL